MPKHCRIQSGVILVCPHHLPLTPQVIGGKAALKFGGRMTLGLAVAVWSLATFLTPILSKTVNTLIMSRIVLGFAEGFCLPTIFHIFALHVPVEERSRAFGYLVALGSVGQTIASLVKKLLFLRRTKMWLFWLLTQMCTQGRFTLVFTVILTTRNNTRQYFYQ